MWAPLVASPLTWRCISFANAGFWGMSSFCSALDHLAPSAYRRIQGDKSLLTSSEWLHVAALAAVNMTVVSYMASLGFEVLTTALHGRLPLETDPFVWYLQAPRLAACVVIVDLWFYWTHRALHWPPLYRTVHKIHHRFTAPCAVVAVYAHPLEFALGNLAAVALGPVLTNAHPYTCAARDRPSHSCMPR
jgi:sterol desaturase/sphingolipid hydroxylase (fatty acid hydroxylase superfamily)